MGFFSWTCAKSKKPVMADCGVRNSPWEFASEVVVLLKNGSKIVGSYDGYGRVMPHNGFEFELVYLNESDWRMVIQRYYDNETFDQLEENGYDLGQGWFYGNNELAQIFNCGHEYVEEGVES